MEGNETREELIFAGALARTAPADRVAYLDQTCAGDVDLRKRLEALLRAHERAAQFLAPPAVEGDIVLDAAPAAPVTEGPGTVIGRYKLLEEIGAGGFGEVWMAEQQEPVRRRVALKIIKLGMDSREVIARFEAERQALALMDHPNIAKVLDGGATGAGRPYFVMELVRGIRITDFCNQNNLPAMARLKLFTQVCHAVQHAHQKGIIHRDLKPSNILVTVNDGPVAAGCPKVIDFGIAKATEQRLTDKTLFTRFGQFLGTPAYMSPEQAEMASLDIDTRSDIYSLGVLLYELLTGRTPFDGKELLEAGLDEMRRTIREVEPVKPSTRLVQERVATRSAVPGNSEIRNPKSEIDNDLDWIVMKCLEKDRTRRYETANGLAADIQRHLDSEPVLAGPPSRIYRLKKMVRRNQGAFAAAALVFIALTGGIAGTTGMYFKANAARQQAAAVSAFLQDDLLRVADSYAQADRQQEINPDLRVREALDRAAERIGNRFQRQPLVEAGIRKAIGDAYLGLGEAKLAVPDLERAWALRKAKLGWRDPDTLDAMGQLAVAYQKSDRLADALAVLEENVKLKKSGLGVGHRSTLAGMSNLAELYRQMGKLPEALALLDETFKLRKTRFGPDDQDTLQTMHNLALAYKATGRLGDAESMSREAVKLATAKFGPDNPKTLAILENLALVYQATGRATNAQLLLEQICNLKKIKLGYDHSDTLTTMDNLAAAYQHTGHLTNAVTLFEETLRLKKAKLGPDHRDTITSMNHLAMAYRATGQASNALALFEETFRVADAKLGRENLHTVTVMDNLSRVYRDAGQWSNAIPLAEGALKVRTQKQGRDHPDTLTSMHNLAMAYRDARQLEDALPLFEEGFKLSKIKLGADDPGTLIRMQVLAKAYQESGHRTEADKLIEEINNLQKAKPGPAPRATPTR